MFLETSCGDCFQNIPIDTMLHKKKDQRRRGRIEELLPVGRSWLGEIQKVYFGEEVDEEMIEEVKTPTHSKNFPVLFLFQVLKNLPHLQLFVVFWGFKEMEERERQGNLFFANFTCRKFKQKIVGKNE